MFFFGGVRGEQNAMQKTSSRLTGSSFLHSGIGLSHILLLQLVWVIPNKYSVFTVPTGIHRDGTEHDFLGKLEFRP